MSKIGRKPVPFTSASVKVDGNTVEISGSKASFTHVMPKELVATVEGKTIEVKPVGELDRKARMLWGLHRALLANKVKGVEIGFEQG
ncbi:50S ribosomal protein L6, partial [Candidatus Dependentiae bacterium]